MRGVGPENLSDPEFIGSKAIADPQKHMEVILTEIKKLIGPSHNNLKTNGANIIKLNWWSCWIKIYRN